MVEAAIFFPIAVFCAMAVMALLLNMYSQAATQAHLHVYIRGEAAAYGDRTQVRLTDAYERDRYRRAAESVAFAVVEGAPGAVSFTKSLEASRTITYYGGRFTNPSGYDTEYFAHSYVIDEASAVRIRDGLTGIIK